MGEVGTPVSTDFLGPKPKKAFVLYNNRVPVAGLTLQFEMTLPYTAPVPPAPVAKPPEVATTQVTVPISVSALVKALTAPPVPPAPAPVAAPAPTPAPVAAPAPTTAAANPPAPAPAAQTQAAAAPKPPAAAPNPAPAPQNPPPAQNPPPVAQPPPATVVQAAPAPAAQKPPESAYNSVSTAAYTSMVQSKLRPTLKEPIFGWPSTKYGYGRPY